MKPFLLLTVLLGLATSYPSFAQYYIEINEGKRVTNKVQVQLRLFGENAVEMMVFNEYDFSSSEWMPYSPTATWEIDALQGLKSVCVKFRDKDGNESPTLVDEIILDNQPPSDGKILIAGGNTYITHHANVAIELSAYDADFMMVANNEQFSKTGWIPFNPKMLIQFLPGDGKKQAFVKFKDLAGNESEVVVDEVILDSEAPTEPTLMLTAPDMIVDSLTGKKYLNQLNTFVDVEVSAKKAEFMKITNGQSNYGLKWRFYDEYFEEWPLNNHKDGEYRITAQFRDKAGNNSPFVTESVIIDTSPPVFCSAVIERNEKYAISEEVTLNLNAADVREMLISENPDFAGAEWEPYKRTRIWSFPTGDGEKKIYVKFRDVAHNESAVYSDEILIDREAPLDCSITLNDGAESTDNKYVEVNVSATDAEMMKIGEDPTLSGVMWRYFVPHPFRLNMSKEAGPKSVYAQFKDNAGNVTEIFKADIVINAMPNRLELAINKGAELLNDPSGNVELDMYAVNATEMMICNNPLFDGAAWRPYRRTLPWKLEEGVGLKTVYAKFRSKTGTETETIRAQITLDYEGPVNGKMTVKAKEGKIHHYYTDIKLEAEGAAFMQASHRPDFMGAEWKRYSQAPFNFLFTTEPGNKTIYYRFRDDAGNVSETFSDSVTVEIQPVQCQVVVDMGEAYCRHPERQVSLKLFAKNATEMRVGNTSNLRGAEWEPYQETKKWALTEGDGDKHVFVQFQSSTGSVSKIVSDDIILDILPPENPSIVLENGKDKVFSYYAQADLRAQGAWLYQTSIHEDFHSAIWLPYSPHQKTVFLGTQSGQITIYARFKDRSGNITEAVQDDIFIAVIPGRCTVEINKGAAFSTNLGNEVKLTLFGENAREMLISNREDFAGAEWQPFQREIDWHLGDEDGKSTVYAKFRSHTGTESRTASDHILVDRSAPYECTIELNATRWWNRLNPDHIQAKAKAKDAVWMQLSEDPVFRHARWQRYTNLPFLFKVSTGDGEKEVFARFKDNWGNISKTVSTTILIDRLPPSNNTVYAKDGNKHVKQADINLYLYSEDAQEIRMANTEHMLKKAIWVKYQEQVSWKLDERGDNIKTVYTQFKDAVGNVSQPVILRLELDRKPPVQAIIMVDGKPLCNDENGLVDLKAHSDGATEMMLSNNQDFTGAVWQEFSSTIPNWALEGADGTHTVYARFRDDSKNETAVGTVNVLLDRQPPQKAIVKINEGADFSNKHRVKLTLQAEGADELIVSNTRLFGMPNKWEPYKPERMWELEHLDGERTVYVKFRDKAGNETPIIETPILLDTEPPVIRSFQINGEETAVDGTGVTLSMKVKKAFYADIPDAKFIRMSNTSDFRGSQWEPYQEDAPWSLGGLGLQRVFIQLKDEAGNICIPYPSQITAY